MTTKTPKQIDSEYRSMLEHSLYGPRTDYCPPWCVESSDDQGHKHRTDAFYLNGGHVIIKLSRENRDGQIPLARTTSPPT